MESTGAGRGVHFGASGGGVSRNRRRFCGGFRSGRRFRRRRLPKQAALLRRLPQRPALPAAASPETGGASTAASAAAGASGGGVSRNRRRFCGGFRSGRRLSTHTKHTEHTEHTENVIRKHTGHTAKHTSFVPARRCARRGCGTVCFGAPSPERLGVARRPARVSMPCACTCPVHAQTAPPDYPLCQAQDPQSIPGSTVKSRIRQSRTHSPQRPASDAATQSAHQRRQSPCSTRIRQHGGASSARVTHGRQSGFVRHAGPRTHDTCAPHEHTGRARRVFFGNIGAPRINAVSMWRPRPGNPSFPIAGDAARCPIRELEAESPQAFANEAATQGARQCRQPPFLLKKRQSALIRHPRGRPYVSRPILEHPIHAVSRHTQHPVEHRANPRPLHDEPRKIPNLQVPG